MLLALSLSLALTQSPERVAVGLHLRNVEGINLEENAYHASFVLWASWHDRAVALEAALPWPLLDAERRAARDRFERIDARSKWLFPFGYALGCAAILGVHLA